MSLPNLMIRTGSAYTLVPATTAGNTVVSAAPCVCVKILVTSTGTGSGTFVNVYDNATTASGNIVIEIPSNAAAGTVYALDCPMTNGIVAKQVTNGPGLCVVFS